jgi:parallel beta-helix repeat protein
LTATVAVLAMGLAAVLPSHSGISAQGATLAVQPGQSIQAAINAAPPGATITVAPGTYHENLLIVKDGITLQGAGAGLTVLEGRNLPTPQNVCLTLFVEPVDVENTGINGICVANVDQQGHMLSTVHDVRVTGFTVQDFPGVGIVFAYTSRVQADHNVAADNGGYGITAFASQHTRFEDNTVHGSDDAGLYLGDSQDADATIKDNTAYDDRWGVLARDSTGGRITGNTLHDNCSGLVFLNTGTKAGVQDWVATNNSTTHNDKSCPADSDVPFNLGGLGILIAGGQHIVLVHNTVRANQPSGAPTTLNGVPVGGIVVASTAQVSVFGPPYYGSDAADNIIVDNTLTDNTPFDLVYDGLGAGNLFRFNACTTSSPTGLCAH